MPDHGDIEEPEVFPYSNYGLRFFAHSKVVKVKREAARGENKTYPQTFLGAGHNITAVDGASN